MTLSGIRRRFAATQPLVADTALAVGLTLASFAQIASLTVLRPDIPARALAVRMAHRPESPMWLVLALVAGAFLPLALRRRVPWLALLLSGGFAIAYTLVPSPPAFVVAGPMIALYTLASTATRRHAGLVALLSGGVVLAAAAVAYTETRWVSEAVGMFALLATATFLGENARSRREHLAEVERRATDAERTREDEALRRVDEERLRIARDVHDILAHSLTIVAVQAAAADALVDTDVTRAHESLGHIRATSKQALSELRSLLGVMRTGDEGAPLGPTADMTHITRLVEQVRETGIDATVQTRGDLGAAPASLSVSAYRIVQEALTNVVRHSGAATATVRLTLEPDALTVEVVDDGRGAGPVDGAEGHGIRGMSERVAALGGRFEAGPLVPDPGFRVFARLPSGRHE